MKSNSPLKERLSITFLIVFLLSTFSHGKILAQEPEAETDHCISPFFYVECKGSTIDPLPLKSTNVDVRISGIIADVTIQQQYTNGGTSPIEAKYIFPASTKAAVYHLRMIIGDRILTAVVKDKEEAQQEYDEAIANGQTATLLEQERPNVFQMSVGNIMPGDTISIVLKYTELITPVEGVYEFVYPTVVGPRYFSQTHSNSSDSTWVEIPYTHEGEAPKMTFDIDVNIDGGMPIQTINSPSHQNLEILYTNPNIAKCGLPDSDSLSGNKDFVLDYVLSGEKNQTGMLTYKGTDENFFLSMIQPPANPSSSDINQREFVFIVDVSGSMDGFPIETSKSLMKQIIQSLNSYEKFNILCFAGGSNVLFDESKMASSENIDIALNFISQLSGYGGTEIMPALEKALAFPISDDYSRIFVIATDGYVTVEKEAFDLISNNLNNANFFAFGIGSSVNRYIIEGIAHAGMGEPFFVLKQSEAEKEAALFRKYIENPVLTNIEAKFNQLTVYDVEPKTIPDVFAERPILILGKWNEPLQGTLTLNGISGTSTPFSQSLTFADYPASENNIALRYLWARQRLQILSDYNSNSYDEEYKQEIIDLGIKYNLLTEYTSFIAVDSIIRNENGEMTTVVVPNPMPEGVSDNAIGGNGGTTVNSEMLETTNKWESKIQSAYPNPFIDQLVVTIYLDDVDLDVEKTLEIYNCYGKKIKTIGISEMNQKANYYSLSDIGFLPKGIYFIQLNLNGFPAGKCKIVKY